MYTRITTIHCISFFAVLFLPVCFKLVYASDPSDLCNREPSSESHLGRNAKQESDECVYTPNHFDASVAQRKDPDVSFYHNLVIDEEDLDGWITSPRNPSTRTLGSEGKRFGFYEVPLQENVKDRCLMKERQKKVHTSTSNFNFDAMPTEPPVKELSIASSKLKEREAKRKYGTWRTYTINTSPQERVHYSEYDDPRAQSPLPQEFLEKANDDGKVTLSSSCATNNSDFLKHLKSLEEQEEEERKKLELQRIEFEKKRKEECIEREKKRMKEYGLDWLLPIRDDIHELFHKRKPWNKKSIEGLLNAIPSSVTGSSLEPSVDQVIDENTVFTGNFIKDVLIEQYFSYQKPLPLRSFVMLLWRGMEYLSTEKNMHFLPLIEEQKDKVVIKESTDVIPTITTQTPVEKKTKSSMAARVVNNLTSLKKKTNQRQQPTATVTEKIPLSYTSHQVVYDYEKLVIVGDLHGQYRDLLAIFEDHGFPGDDLKSTHERYDPETKIHTTIRIHRIGYLFNGDFVDRGDMGIEVLCLVICLKLAFPKTVFLTRGNHEDMNMAKGGFHLDLKLRYRMHPSYFSSSQVNVKTYDKTWFNYDSQEFKKSPWEMLYEKLLRNVCEATFHSIPLTALLYNNYFLTHGGIYEEEEVTEEKVACKRPVSKWFDFYDPIYNSEAGYDYLSQNYSMLMRQQRINSRRGINQKAIVRPTAEDKYWDKLGNYTLPKTRYETYYKIERKVKSIPLTWEKIQGLNRYTSSDPAVMQLLWNDPALPDKFDIIARGMTKNQGRGDVVRFWGPDVTDRFIKENKVYMIIRSHQMVMEGFEQVHDDRVATVFSCPNYTNWGKNKGAVLVFTNHGHQVIKYTMRNVHYPPKTKEEEEEERLEKEKLEKERIEKETLEREAKKKAALERIEKEMLEREAKRRAELERIEREEIERQAREDQKLKDNIIAFLDQKDRQTVIKELENELAELKMKQINGTATDIETKMLIVGLKVFRESGIYDEFNEETRIYIDHLEKIVVNNHNHLMPFPKIEPFLNKNEPQHQPHIQTHEQVQPPPIIQESPSTDLKADSDSHNPKLFNLNLPFGLDKLTKSTKDIISDFIPSALLQSFAHPISTLSSYVFGPSSNPSLTSQEHHDQEVSSSSTLKVSLTPSVQSLEENFNALTIESSQHPSPSSEESIAPSLPPKCLTPDESTFTSTGYATNTATTVSELNADNQDDVECESRRSSDSEWSESDIEEEGEHDSEKTLADHEILKSENQIENEGKYSDEVEICIDEQSNLSDESLKTQLELENENYS